MADKLTSCAVVSYVFILVGLGLHVAGFVTAYWMTGESKDDSGESVIKFNFGLWDMQQEFSNGTALQTESPLAKKEEQYIVFAIAATNAVLCLVVLIKAVHVCVGLVSFISVAMMVIAAFFVSRNVESQKDRLLEARSHWTNLQVSYSLYLTFAGIIVNILATVAFLTLLLIREERKAALSTKSFGVGEPSTSDTARLESNDVLDKNRKAQSGDIIAETSKTKTEQKKQVSVSVIAGNNNYAYENATYTSMHHSGQAGPSDDDSFNHIHIESSRL